MTEKINDLSGQKWQCQFWQKNDENRRIYGELRYSLARGLEIEAIGQVDPSIFEHTRTLYGSSVELGKFTLFGCTSVGWAQSPDAVRIELSACYMIIGVHVAKDEVKKCIFTINQLSEFCRTSMERKGLTSFEHQILRGRFRGLKFWLGQDYSDVEMVNTERISDGFIISSNLSDEDAHNVLRRIDSVVAEILEEDKSIFLFKKKEARFLITLESESPPGIHQLHQAVYAVSSLLSIVMLRKCIPIHLTLFLSPQTPEQEEESGIIEYQMLISHYLNRHEELQVRNSSFDPFRDISAKDLALCFDQTLMAWEELLETPLNLPLSVIKQYIRGEYNPAQYIALCISALEEWFSNYETHSKPKEKYDFMLNKYSTRWMIEKLDDYLPYEPTEKGRGELLSKVRAQVLHPSGKKGVPLKEGRSLDEATILNISEVLTLVLLRALYSRLGLSAHVIEQFGGEQRPVLQEHFFIIG
jgi:hypothetical protein